MRMFGKRIGVLCFFLLGIHVLWAQEHKQDTVSQDSVKQVLLTRQGVIVGGDEKESLPGAYIYLGETKTPVGTTDVDGRFVIQGVRAGKIQLSVSYIGYETYSGLFEIKEDTDIGQICLKTVLLEEVVVEAKVPIAVQHGDTTKFNASAVKVAVDGDLEALIKKLPGFEIVDGKIIAQGKEVTRLFIDGMEYSFNDPAAALKNLPAKLVNKISMYDRGSDEAEFSGYQDGKKFRALNIETHEPNKAKIFGRASVAYGITSPVKNTFEENNYNGDIYGNYFDRKNKITLNADASNQGQRFNMPGSCFGGGKGYNRSEGIYANVSTDIVENWSISTNYRWSDNASNSASMSKQEYFSTEQYENRIYDNESRSRRDGNNHSFNARVEYTPSKKSRFVFSPSISTGKSNSWSIAYGSNVENNDTVNVSNTENWSDGNTLRVNGSVLWMQAFRKKGRSMTMNITGGYSRNLSNRWQSNDEHSLKMDGVYLDTLRNLATDNNQKDYNWSASLRWSEPLSEHSRLTLNYMYQDRMSNADQASLSYRDKDFQELIGIDSTQTNELKNVYHVHNYGINYSFTNDKLRLGTGLSFSNTTMDNRYRYLAKSDSVLISRYMDVSPMMSFGCQINDDSNLDVTYSGNSSSPSVTQLQNVLTISDPLQVSKGNPNLKKSFTHNLMMNYTYSQLESSGFLNATLSAGQTFNMISSNVQFINRDTIVDGYLLARGASLTVPVNLNGSWNLSGSVAYSFPWEKLKLRFNTSMGYSFSHTPSIYNNLENMNSSHTGTMSVSIYTNISEDIDCYLSSSNTLSWSENSETGNARYYNSNLNGSFNWIFWRGFYVETMYNGSFHITKKDERVKQSEHILNATVGKKFGKERQFKVSLSANDILQNRRSMTYSLTDLSTNVSYNTVPSTCIMLGVSYRFDNMKRH